MSEQQQPPQQQYMQHQPQQPMSPVQPANVYTPPVHSPDAIQTTPQGQSHQALPPSYDQAKVAPQGVPVPGHNGVAATVVPLNMLGDQPQPIDCPFCHRRTMTEIRKEGSSMQILVGALFCLVCVCLTCVPCLAHWFEDAEYRCNQCKNMVARRRHDGPMEVLGPQAAVYSQYGQQPQMNAQGQQAQGAPVQTKDASGLAQPQQYEMQPQQLQYHQQQQQHHYQQQQQQQQSGQVQEIQPVYHQPQQYQQQQYAQAGTPQPDQKH
ncbi:LPS-induced tumor necrosis factor alpha factor [Akanthomyces lecanii RCEF 1005]|uniref:LPS-induced tumor necrosis factor alpha factor n=1 Tax=Akanthomyces lecanii RCEF 1005 TaxID=1081108 RepID=A0A162KEH0_CORDF|nr:LPS-induced tumor necrosis factor alpha factor [Akanthomyces lecanii RCEF 1005]